MMFLFSSVPSFAQEESFQISTSQEIYYYGDFLTFTVHISEVTEQTATLFIIDENGKSSSPIPMLIGDEDTTIISPFPFEPQIYPQGKYTLKIQYTDMETTTEFVLKDSGRIVIPGWIKDVGLLWTDDMISDTTFATAIEFLIENDIIVIPQTESQQTEKEVSIPTWVKTNTEWWTQGLITDEDFAKGLQFLIKIGVIVV